jgi:predicted CXXCH cytochrome family protein
MCFYCHSESSFLYSNVHSPVKEGKCFECHGNHSSKYGRLMKYRGNSVCKKCHANLLKQPHPKVVFQKLASKEKQKDLASRLFGEKKRLRHPLRGKDPLREGRSFGCISCHMPHSADSQYLIRYKVTEPADLCLYCHKEGKK